MSSLTVTILSCSLHLPLFDVSLSLSLSLSLPLPLDEPVLIDAKEDKEAKRNKKACNNIIPTQRTNTSGHKKFAVQKTQSQGLMPVKCAVASPHPPSRLHVQAEGCPKRLVLGLFFVTKYRDLFCDQGGVGGVRGKT